MNNKRRKNIRYEWLKFINVILYGKLVRDWMEWGTYGKSGKEPLRWVILKDISDEHIQAILDTQHQICSFYRKEFKNELKYRKQYPTLSIKEIKKHYE